MNLKTALFLITTFFAFVASSFAQEKFTLSGIVTDAKNNEPISGINISVAGQKVKTSTNDNGYYAIFLPKGNYTLTTSAIGFKSEEVSISISKNTKLNFFLVESGEELQEVVIQDNKTKTNTRKAEMSVNKLTLAAIKKMPVVMGEVDVIKSILLLPGVTNGGEGASGFNVRGGGADQNLILLDGANLFNSSHVFGFFSIFNPETVKDLTLYKGGIPARYGGRASSVLEVNQRDGNNQNFHMSGGIGLIMSRLAAEGPISKGKGSFLVAGRGSYANLFLKLAHNNNSAYFYDLNTKLNYKLSNNNNLMFSGYFGRDVFNLNGIFINTYGNATANLRWNHQFSDATSSSMSTIYGDYTYNLELSTVGFRYNSGIKNYNFKYDFKTAVSDKIKLNYGVNAIYYDFNPATIIPVGSTSSVNYKQLDKKYAFEPSAYLEASQDFGEKFSMTYGLRYSLFYRLGASNVNIYQNNQAVVWNDQLKIYEQGTPIGTKHYGSNDVITTYGNLEPRAALSYSLDHRQSIKASYNRMAQYLQLVTNTSSPTPLDVWTPSDQYIKPQIADQVALGYFRNFHKDDYSLETEVFYKTVKNRIDYIDGANLIANDALEQVILNGRMRSYGLEFMLRKNTGKLNGWISYTLSKSQQQTPGRTPEELGINNGNWYNSAYNKLHNIAITANYTRSKKWNYGANFILQSGQPVTFPNGQYQYQGITIPSYAGRNTNNLPIYNHLDLAATYTPKPNKKKGWQSEWVFSIYNVYNRHNAASISFRQNQDTGQNEAVRLSIFGAVPAVSYNFKF